MKVCVRGCRMEEVCAYVEVEQFATVGHYCNGQEQRMHEWHVHTLLNRGMVSRVAQQSKQRYA